MKLLRSTALGASAIAFVGACILFVLAYSRGNIAPLTLSSPPETRWTWRYNDNTFEGVIRNGSGGRFDEGGLEIISKMGEHVLFSAYVLSEQETYLFGGRPPYLCPVNLDKDNDLEVLIDQPSMGEVARTKTIAAGTYEVDFEKGQVNLLKVPYFRSVFIVPVRARRMAYLLLMFSLATLPICFRLRHRTAANCQSDSPTY